jgi:rubrerythrin
MHNDSHTHEHTHGPVFGQASAKTRTILEYMLEHNRRHTGELSGVAEKLREEGLGTAADLVMEAAKNFEDGNEKLAKALSLTPTIC